MNQKEENKYHLDKMTTHTKRSLIRGHVVIIGDDLSEVEGFMFDWVNEGYRIIHTPRRTYMGFGNRYVSRLEQAKGQLEQRMEGRR